MRTWLGTLAFLLAIALVGRFASAADNGGWNLPSLNPFAGKGKSSTSGHVSDAPMSGWHAPKLWPSTVPAKRKANQPSTWHKMTTGTQNMFAKTAGALNPWDDNKPKPPPKLTGSNSIFTKSGQAKKETKSSVLPASWWSSDDKEGQPASVNAFLSQPRPH
jgi:hypothetical protein